MVTKRDLYVALIVTLGFAACAVFPYHYYGLEGVDYAEGKLLGPKPTDDKPFMDCIPTTADAHPCVVMFSKDFFAFKLDYEDTQQKLKECQQASPAPAVVIK